MGGRVGVAGRCGLGLLSAGRGQRGRGLRPRGGGSTWAPRGGACCFRGGSTGRSLRPRGGAGAGRGAASAGASRTWRAPGSRGSSFSRAWPRSTCSPSPLCTRRSRVRAPSAGKPTVFAPTSPAGGRRGPGLDAGPGAQGCAARRGAAGLSAAGHDAFLPAGLYGPDGILPARRTLRPQGKGRWRQLWETPTLLWEAPALGLDTAQGLELLSLLGTLLALGALLLRPLRHPLVYLLLWAAYLSAYQASGAAHRPRCCSRCPAGPAGLARLCRHALFPAGGPGVPVLPVVSGCVPRHGGWAVLAAPGRPQGALGPLPTGTLCCWRRAS